MGIDTYIQVALTLDSWGQRRARSMMPPAIVTTRCGRHIQLRSITPEDTALLVGLFHQLSPETRRYSFLEPLPARTDAQIWPVARRLAAINPAYEEAVLATVSSGGAAEAIGVARFACKPDDPGRGEFAIVVRDDYQREGLGTAMMQRLIL